jgi:hypothetical protein
MVKDREGTRLLFSDKAEQLNTSSSWCTRVAIALKIVGLVDDG